MTMNPTLIKIAGAGRAYQSVAQSAAIAIQDATDYMRNMSTIAVTATGIGMAQLVAGISNGQKVIDAATKLIGTTVTNYTNITQAAIQVATNFPKSFS
jgi:methylphosphotriester-DNA--protein-cysteine methyltransferase